MKTLIFLPVLLLAACTLNSNPNQASVPVVPDCAPDSLVHKSVDGGWDCISLLSVIAMGVTGPTGATGLSAPAPTQPCGADQYATWSGTAWECVSLPSFGTYAPLNSPAFTGTPTAPTAPLGESSTQLATTAFANPEASLASSGYQKFPSGLIMQWGLTGSISSGGSLSITFPVDFPTACQNVVMQTTAASVILYPTTLSTTGFTAHNSAGQVNTAYWMAIGY